MGWWPQGPRPIVSLGSWRGLCGLLPIDSLPVPYFVTDQLCQASECGTAVRLAGLRCSSWLPCFTSFPTWAPGPEGSCESESWVLLTAVFGGGGLRGGELLELGSLGLVSASLHSSPGLGWAPQPLSLHATLG